MSIDKHLRRFGQEAGKGGMPIDREVYRSAGRDPLEPVLLGSGSLGARLGIFGRDPGRHEVLEGEPFIGKGGQLIREQLHRALHGEGVPYSPAAGLEAGRRVFWGNTVPYKPVGNKAWSVGVKRRFAPIVADILVHEWSGHDLITCGNVAFDWFRLVDPTLRPVLSEFWQRPDRYEATLAITLHGKAIRLHPLPHPSPLNAVWYKRFPALLASRLAAIDWS